MHDLAELVVWLATFPRGLFRPIFMKKCQTEGGELNREKIIKRALIQVFRNRYKEKRLYLLAQLTELVFWPEQQLTTPVLPRSSSRTGRTAC